MPYDPNYITIDPYQGSGQQTAPSLMSMITQPNLQTPVPQGQIPMGPTGVPGMTQGGQVPAPQLAPPGMTPGQANGAMPPGPGGTPVNVPNHSLTGILGIHGVPGQLLNWLGDTIATASGMQLPFKNDPTLRAQAQATQGMFSDPATARLAATGDTQGALEARNQQIQMQHEMALMGIEKQRADNETATANQTLGDTIRRQAGAVMANATPATYPGLYDQVMNTFGNKTDLYGNKVDLTPLNLPAPNTIDSTNGFTDDQKAALRTAGEFGVQQYKYAGTDAAQVAANARATGAATGQAEMPSVIAKNFGEAGAAGTNAHAHVIQAQASAEQAGTAKDKYDSETGQNGAPPMQRPSRPRPSGAAPGGSSANYPTISASRLPSGAQTGTINGRRAARINGQTFYIQ